ncbi:hypothetical protein AB8B02_05850 [Tardiphaga sp. 862_B3_N4_1]|uniref:hypothetical protein n=1 Tax=Tardiphaga sp. 862_B3_N4_1 TaxID=3240764 RepID=UPI003F287539
MNKPKADDVDKQGGWMVRVKTPPTLERLFYVYELDRSKALQMAKAAIQVNEGETLEAIGPANIHAMTGIDMRPGDVKQYA